MNNSERKFSTSDQFYQNPYPTYEELRRDDPIHWNEESNSWLITRYTDVFSGLNDPRLRVKRNKRKITDLSEEEQEQIGPLKEFYSNWLLYSDPPEHTRLRRIVNKVFTPRAINKRKEEIEYISKKLVDDVNVNASETDIHGEFSSKLGIMVVAHTLGLDPKDYIKVKEWTHDIVGFVVGKTKGADGAFAAQRSLEDFNSHLNETFFDGRSYPEGSVLEALSSSQTENGISIEEAFAIYGNILLDGHEPLANGVTNGILAMLQNPEQMNLLRQNSDLLPFATEEFLRYHSPFQFSARIANEDIEMRSKQIRKGQKVRLVIGSANRDPDTFEEPNKLDITRTENKHLAFAHGQHYCLGATLARPTLQAAYRNLLTKFPLMEMTDKQLEWQKSFAIRELKELPVKL